MRGLLFARMRHAVMILGDQPGVVAEDLAMTAPRTLVLLITLPPAPQVLKPLLAYAGTAGSTS